MTTAMTMTALAVGCASTPEAPNAADKAAVKAVLPALTAAVTVPGFMTPESVLHDVARDVYYVSNINGSPSGKDDNGFISKLSPTGEVLSLKFIDGAAADITLNAPKGMGIVGNRLIVTDIDAIRSFDLETGKSLGDIAVEGATFLNDVAVDGGQALVSDSGLTFDGTGFQPTGADAVYLVDTATNGVKKLVAGKDTLPRANGVAFHDGAAWVNFFGDARIERFDLDTGASVARWPLPAGSLDGLVPDGAGGFYTSSWESSSIYRVDSTGAATVVKDGLKSPADIGLDAGRKTLLVPLFMENTVVLLPL